MKLRSGSILSWKPDFFDILLAEGRRESAKKRVHVERGRYMYHPSEEYRRFISHKIPVVIHKKH